MRYQPVPLGHGKSWAASARFSRTRHANGTRPRGRADAEPGAFQSDDPQRALAPLLPKRRLGLPFAIALPESLIEINEALSALAQFLPFDEAEDYQEHLRLLDRLARWLRLI
jgi:hypothetical protein